MNDARPSYRDFRRRLLAGLHLLGTFVKTQTSHATEMLGLLGFDFVVFDQEHAPLGQSALDVMILAARAANITPIVRVGDPGQPNILSALDSGALGVLVPHVSTVGKAEEIAAACRYRGGRQFGVARIDVAGGVQGLLAEGRRADGIDGTGQRQFRGRFNEGVGRLAALRRHLAERQIGQRVARLQDGHSFTFAHFFGRGIAANLAEVQMPAEYGHDSLEAPNVADDQGSEVPSPLGEGPSR